MGVDVGTATGYLDLDISGFLSGLKTAQDEANKQTKSMSEKISQGFQGVGSTLSSVGSTLTKGVTVPIVGLGTAMVKSGINFESSMTKVKSISSATGEDFERLKSKAREMGEDTKFSASEAADAFQYMAMAGWDVDNMLGGISGVMDLAAASGEDLASVSDIVTDAMTAFGLSADETSMVLKDGVMQEVDNTTRFVDALAAASNKSNTSVSMLGASFKSVAPVAGSLGYSVEDTSIALGLMANSGIKAEQAGTALKNILSNMSNPTKTMAVAMDTLGVSLTDGEGNMLSLMDIMKDLRSGFSQGHGDVNEFNKGLEALNEAYSQGEVSENEYSDSLKNLLISMYGAEGAQKAMLASQLAGKEGMAGLLAIVNSSEEDFNKLSEGIYNASGTAEEMAEIMEDTLEGQIAALGSKLGELSITFSDMLIPVIRDVVSWLQGFIDKLNELSPEQKEQIARWAAIAAAIGPVLLTLGKISSSIGSLITTFGKVPSAISKVQTGFSSLSGAIAGISAPVAAVAAVIAVLVVSFATLWTTNEEFRNNIIETWESIKSKFEEFGQGIVDRLNDMGFQFESFSEVVTAIWTAFTELLGPVFENVFSQLGVIISSALDLITGIFDIFAGLFSRDWDQFWNGIKEVFGAVWSLITGTFESWGNAFKGVVDVVLGWFGTSWESIWNGVSNFFITIWEGISSFFSGVLEGIKAVVTNAWNVISNVTSTVFSAVSGIISTIWNGIKTVITTVVNTIKSAITIAWNEIQTVITTVMNGIKTVITTVWNEIRVTISTVINGIKSTLETVWNAIRTVISNVVNSIKTTVTNVFELMKNAIVNTVNNIKTTVTNTFNTIKSTLTSIVTNIKDSVSSTFEGIKSAMSDAVEKAKDLVVDSMRKAKDLVVGVWDGITDTFADIGKNMIQGIINGIGGMVGKLYDSIKEALSGLVDKAKDALDINSPSGVMRDQIGKWMPPGIAVGFNSAMGEAAKDMQKSLDNGINSLETSNIHVGVNGDIASSFNAVADYYESIEHRLVNSVASMKSNLEYLIDAGTKAATGASLGYIGYNGIASGSAGGTETGTVTQKPSNGGNTYIFYSNKAIDEIEAARQMQRAERDMTEGFA